MNRKLAKAFCKGICIYSLLVWLYIIVDVHLWPSQLHDRLSSLVPIRQDFVAMTLFAISGISFIMWEYLRS